MKLKEKQKAISLRSKGKSINEIAKEVGVSKGSVSRWVKEIRLSERILRKIKSRSHSTAAVEARRQSRLLKEAVKRDFKISKARGAIRKISKDELFLIGVALYWGEGSKKKRNVVEFTNSDPAMIVVMMNFFQKVCKVPKKKFRGHVYLHNHLEPAVAEKYWSKISSIPKSQFHKTSVQHNKNRIKKDTLPYGTFAIVVCDTNLKLSIDGWILGMCDKLV